MSDEIISVRVGKDMKQRMKMRDEINWSAVMRKAILQSLEKERKINLQKAKEASRTIEKIRKSGDFSGGRTGVEIIREWRNKRK